MQAREGTQQLLSITWQEGRESASYRR